MMFFSVTSFTSSLCVVLYSRSSKLHESFTICFPQLFLWKYCDADITTILSGFPEVTSKRSTAVSHTLSSTFPKKFSNLDKWIPVCQTKHTLYIPLIGVSSTIFFLPRCKGYLPFFPKLFNRLSLIMAHLESHLSHRVFAKVSP